jgi:hypothetical protein
MIQQKNSNDWLKYVIRIYDAKIHHTDANMFALSYHLEWDGILHEPIRRSRYFSEDNKIYEVGPVGDIVGEITDTELLKLFSKAKNGTN